MSDLKEKKCVPCEGNVEPFDKNKIEKFKSKVSEDWDVIDNKRIKKDYRFNDFKEGMNFAQKVAKIAEEEQHHPDMCVHYGSVDVQFTTHAIGGLSENDFIMAAKIDQV
ncbi:MAG: 4a-hydroxytetrahydrobiopterin dehydratase [Calditrichaeota bacterium]|nr:4a-hydroxytetrahydrobiopterin dehydratase [Calditrichota bacterium]